ncbi:hypothetical protein PGT21_036764 [Puccinia graminis f. sp. tritici]|uniref:Uncharacterized protein n=1 Tax=Puccinia graminis f. sp. tritici TaxID=56615 RepID=A0A5B0RL71_PUCGR|nr:hypothetical protein PGT21_036764 [Puccinia graminis f. sp. tritici]KAA1126159.1 hypothetical protein PGTUg99_003312 [Puccinia graminis f. sp. tritici]
MEPAFFGVLLALLDTFVRFVNANIPLFRRRWSVEEMPELKGRIAIVTGGNTGIGFFVCLELARRGAKVYLASRSESRAKAAIQKIKELIPDSQVDFIHFDLTILSSARKAADSFISKEARLDILINNAGILGTPYKLSPDGIELQACNATGHFALTSHLLPILKNTAVSFPDSHVRVVNVASMAYLQAITPDLSSLEGLNRADDSPMGGYNHSKLNNVLFTNELQKRLSDTSIRCLSVHPGFVASGITRDAFDNEVFAYFLMKIIRPFFAAPCKGAITPLYAATSPEIELKNLRASYLVPYGQVGKKTPLAEDKEGRLGQQFWRLCEMLMKAAEDKQK